MKHSLFPILLLTLLLLSPLARAQSDEADNNVRDSVYYTMEDGIESPEEMEKEAQYVYELCSSNAYKSLYFDCQCIAGAFLQRREKVGPTIPQNDIVDGITRAENRTPGAPTCINAVAIAGNAYSNCLGYADTYRRQETDNEEYCSCVGKRLASEFGKRPYLRTDYIQSMQTDAMLFCDNPANRPGAKNAP